MGLAIVHGLNDFLPDFLNQIFLYQEDASADSYTSGDVGTTVVYVIQLLIEIVCLIYVYRKVARTIDYQKVLESYD